MKNRFGSAVLSLVLIVLSLAVFAACGTPSSGPAATEKASTEKPGTVDDTTPVPVSDPTDAPTGRYQTSSGERDNGLLRGFFIIR